MIAQKNRYKRLSNIKEYDSSNSKDVVFKNQQKCNKKCRYLQRLFTYMDETQRLRKQLSK